MAELERDGYEAQGARDAVKQFEELQKLHIADRDRLLKELGLNGSGRSPMAVQESRGATMINELGQTVASV